MTNKITSIDLAGKIWIHAALTVSIGIFIYSLIIGASGLSFLILVLAVLTASAVSLPAFIILLFLLPLILKILKTYKQRITALLFFLLSISFSYGSFMVIIYNTRFAGNASLQSFLISAGLSFISVFATTLISFFINRKYIRIYFLSINKNITTMEENSVHAIAQTNQKSHSNKIWIKGVMTAALILLMLIPTVFVSNLVEERQARQEEVKKEVSSKWAGKQNITFPYLYLPYTITTVASNGKITVEKKSFLILPENLNVSGAVTTEQRLRSIYSVLLYNSSLAAKGSFDIHIPDDVDPSAVDWGGVKLCLGISDFKGIQQKIAAKINNVFYDFSAGLPTNQIDPTGLSSSVILNADDIGKQISFELPLKIKGSDQLDFTPLAGNSQFILTSNWNSPSFDGNALPSERNLNNQGFEANWNFNKANLPFNTVLKNFNFKRDDYAFGVSLLQPTDQYAKTLRCVKYAILFIGLSFSLFFIVEIMQKKPFHPVQYVLVGLALIVFYTLLLSISEFLQFDIAYLIASAATVLLVTIYAKSHFNKWTVASVFAGIIGAIYGFIFVLIRLEDTALLVGSIGLFVILALVMYVSRKINWYGNTVIESATI
jgi:inner membrane protein